MKSKTMKNADLTACAKIEDIGRVPVTGKKHSQVRLKSTLRERSKYFLRIDVQSFRAPKAKQTQEFSVSPLLRLPYVGAAISENKMFLQTSPGKKESD